MALAQSGSEESVAGRERGGGPDFYRSPRRVAILMVVAPLFYWFWWLWQLFKFTSREHFPRARKFWWIFAPFYGLYILYQQFDDIKAKAKASGHPFNSVLAGWLAFIGLYGGGGSSQTFGWADVLGLIVSGGALAGAAFLVQRGANSYVRVTYPTEQPRSITAGEIVAGLLGIVLLALFILLAFSRAGS